MADHLKVDMKQAIKTFKRIGETMRAFNQDMEEVSRAMARALTPALQSIQEAAARAVQQIGTNFVAYRKMVIEVTLVGPHLDFWEEWTSAEWPDQISVFPPRVFDHDSRSWQGLLHGIVNGFTHDEFGDSRLSFKRDGDSAVLRCSCSYRDRGQTRAFFDWIEPQVREGVIMVRNIGSRSWVGRFYKGGGSRRLSLPEDNPELPFELLGHVPFDAQEVDGDQSDGV